jgi:hypothetical protein
MSHVRIDQQAVVFQPTHGLRYFPGVNREVVIKERQYVFGRQGAPGYHQFER